jgi:hypothetical protein
MMAVVTYYLDASITNDWTNSNGNVLSQSKLHTTYNLNIKAVAVVEDANEKVFASFYSYTQQQHLSQFAAAATGSSIKWIAIRQQTGYPGKIWRVYIIDSGGPRGPPAI